MDPAGSSAGRDRADAIRKDVDIGAPRAPVGAGRCGIRRAGVRERISAFGCPVVENGAVPVGLDVAAAVAGIARTERVNVRAAWRRRRWLFTKQRAVGHTFLQSVGLLPLYGGR